MSRVLLWRPTEPLPNAFYRHAADKIKLDVIASITAALCVSKGGALGSSFSNNDVTRHTGVARTDYLIT
jgi:hypothetical protein